MNQKILDKDKKKDSEKVPMNKIKELVEQAAQNFTENFQWDYCLQIDKDIFNKFAELIVHECVHICDETRLNYLTSRKSAADYEEKQIYNEGIAASDHIKYKIIKSLGCGSYE